MALLLEQTPISIYMPKQFHKLCTKNDWITFFFLVLELYINGKKESFIWLNEVGNGE